MPGNHHTAINPPEVLGLGPFDPAREARQSEADSADVNKIVQRFQSGGVLPEGTGPGTFADVSQMSDYREALDTVRRADDMFQRLPADVRAKFKNDTAEFLDFMSQADEKAMADAGVIARKDDVPVPAPEAPVVPPAA